MCLSDLWCVLYGKINVEIFFKDRHDQRSTGNSIFAMSSVKDIKTSIDVKIIKSSTSLVGSIDQGTSSSRFILFSGDTGQPCASAQVKFIYIYWLFIGTIALNCYLFLYVLNVWSMSSRWKKKLIFILWIPCLCYSLDVYVYKY